MAIPLALNLQDWVREQDLPAFLQLRAASPWWSSGYARLMYSDAPELFHLAEELRLRGYDPAVFAVSRLVSEIDLTAKAIKWPIAIGVLAATAAIGLAIVSDWLYVEPWLAWWVAAIVGSFSAAIIILWGRMTRCDATSIVGAVIAGALGMALFATIAAPDMSALLAGDTPAVRFTPNADGSWTSEEPGPVTTLPEPPVRALREPTMLHVACGIPMLCAFKRTDFRF